MTVEGLGELARASVGCCRCEPACWALVEGDVGCAFPTSWGPGGAGGVICSEIAGELGLLARSSVMGVCGTSSILRFSDVVSGDTGDEVGDEVEEAESWSEMPVMMAVGLVGLGGLGVGGTQLDVMTW